MKFKFTNILIKILSLFFRLTRRLNFKLFRQARFQSFEPKLEYAFSSIEWGGGREHYICFPYDQAISKHVYVDGHFGWALIPKVIKILGTEFKLKTLIDIGANIGTVCIPLIKRGYAEKAIAFEPEPKNFRALMANIYINGLADRIVAHNIALGSDNKEILFELSGDNSGDHRVRIQENDGKYFESKRETITVKSMILDDIITSPDKDSTLIWMDTQGYEGKILEGSNKICKLGIPLVVEFWPYGLIRANCYNEFLKAVLHYKKYYDLSETEYIARDVTEAAMNNLYNKFQHSDGWTDLLLV